MDILEIYCVVSKQLFHFFFLFLFFDCQQLSSSWRSVSFFLLPNGLIRIFIISSQKLLLKLLLLFLSQLLRMNSKLDSILCKFIGFLILTCLLDFKTFLFTFCVSSYNFSGSSILWYKFILGSLLQLSPNIKSNMETLNLLPIWEIMQSQNILVNEIVEFCIRFSFFKNADDDL